MIVRREGPGDAGKIRRLTEAVFGGLAEAALVDALRAGGHMALSLVAEEAARIVGHVLFSPLVAPAKALALAPVTVAPARQRRGIGSRLIRGGLDLARENGWRAVFVVGEPLYYGRFGFRSEVAAKYTTPYPQAYVMAIELDPGALAGGGEVVYSEPFRALG